MVQTNDLSGQEPDTKDVARDQASGLKDTAVEHVGAVTEEAKAKATDVVHDVRRELETQGDAQAKRLATVLRDAGRQLQDMADGAEAGPVGQVTRQLASGTERFAGRLEHGGLQGVGEDLRGFARRQPGLFLVAAGVAGFVVTRMLRSASSAQPAPGPWSQSSGAISGAGSASLPTPAEGENEVATVATTPGSDLR